MTHSSPAVNGSVPDDLQPGPAPERDVVAYEELDARLRLRDERKTQPLCASHNPLVAAASRLLSTLTRLKPQESVNAITTLRERLGKRVLQFTRQALQAGVDAKTVNLASYVLCTVADEAVSTSAWGMKSDWAINSLLHGFHGETSGGARFFQLLEQYMRLAASHVEILELMYLCLALGYEGRYATTEQGGKDLLKLRHTLFACIQRQRGETSSKASRVVLPERHELRRQILLIPGWLPALLTLFSLGLMYSAFAWTIGQQREKALLPFQQLGALSVAPVMERGGSQ
jgi:type VI secretion system protein ImpK